MDAHICGIQQVGIGVEALKPSWKWYRDVFSMDVRIFEDAAEAPLMTNYTGGKVHKRIAALAMNMRGGGGFEIWQYTSRKPVSSSFAAGLNYLGMLAVKMKTPDARAAHQAFTQMGLRVLSAPVPNPAGNLHFWVADPSGNWFDVVEAKDWFRHNSNVTGGAQGAVIGVGNMPKALAFYRDMLGFDTILADVNGVADDLPNVPGQSIPMRRVILTQSHQGTGPFTPLLGLNQLELVQSLEGHKGHLYKDRYWGDLGFIHLCFDVRGMDALKKKGEKLGYPFTVDSANSFDMGKAAGRFGYVEDPDGTLIEFVETHKLPIVEKWGWYMDLRKRNQEKSLPKWMLNCFRFNRVTD